MILAVLLAAFTNAAEPEGAAPVSSPAYRSVFDRRTPPPATYEGDFRQAPYPHWSRALPGGRMNAASHAELSRPVVVGEGILMGSAAAESLFLLSRRDGSVVRSFPAAASVDSEALVIGDYVFFSDTGGYTWCYKLDGTEVWSHQGNAPILVRPTFFEGTLYVTNVDDLVVALDAGTGELSWRYQQKPDLDRTAELALYAAPPAQVVGDEVLVGFSTGDFVGLDRKTGDLQWSQRIGAGRYPDIVAEPSVSGDLILVSGYFEPLVALDRLTKRAQWSLEKGSAAGSLIADRDGTAVVYHPGTDGVLRAVDVKSGDMVWMWTSGQSGALTTPVLTDAGIIIGSSSGTVHLLDADSGAHHWSYDPGVVMEGVTSAPVVDGRQMIFASNAGILYSFLAPKAPRAHKRPYPEGRRRVLQERPTADTIKLIESPADAGTE